MSVAVPVVDSWDGPNRRIYIKQGIDTFHWIDDIYIEYRQARRLETNDLRKFEAFMIASGNEAKGLGKATPRLLKLLLGVKVIFFNEGGEKTVLGEAITDDADNDPTLYDNSSLTTPIVINYQPPAAEVIVVDAIAKSLDYGGILVYDENNVDGVGQEHPVGTTANPVNNIIDGIALGIKFHLSEVNALSDITLTQDVVNWKVNGIKANITFYPAGFKADICKFRDINLSGNFNNSYIDVVGGNVMEALNVHGKIKDAFHSGRILIAAGNNLNMADCESGIPGLDSPEVDMNQGNNTSFSSRNFSGGQTINYCDTPSDIATLSFTDGGKPHLEPTNTGGIISVRGIGVMDDRSNGTVVDSSALLDPTYVELIRDILEGDMVPTAAEWKILQKNTKAVLVRKDANEVNGLTQLTE